MALTQGLLTLEDSLRLVHSAILAVELALNRGPAADTSAVLRNQLDKLQAAKAQLIDLHARIAGGDVDVPAPHPELISRVRTASSHVETATRSAMAATVVIAAVAQAVNAANSVMTFAGPHRPAEPPDVEPGDL